MSITKNTLSKFHTTVMDYYTQHARHDLPWRKNTSAYYVIVSEIMLQQTQVERVIPFFKNWIQLFPNFKQLATASQIDVLRAWKGLGYNSRALRLQKLAQVVTSEYAGKIPKDKKLLEKLPGIGPYTAGAVMAFVYDTPVVMIETNIRRVFLHHFFNTEKESISKNIHDRDILSLIEKTLPEKNIQEWYWALMDYGSFLGRELKHHGKKYNPNTNSRHYTKQSVFKGSDRQIRGQILEILLQSKTEKISLSKLCKELKDLSGDFERIEIIVDSLEKENFLYITGEYVVLKK